MAVYEHLLQARPSSIGAVNLSSNIVCDPARQIAVIPVATSVTGTHEQIRRIEQLLARFIGRSCLRSWEMQRQGNAYSATLQAHLLVPMHRDWPLDALTVRSAPGNDPRG